MNFRKYRTELNEQNHNILVEEQNFTYSCQHLNEPVIIYDMVSEVFKMQYLAEEYVYMFAMNSKFSVLGLFEISHGTVNSSLVSPREIFIRAILCGATSIILVHNHPSGETMPSRDDERLTIRIDEAGKLLNIKLTDHIIIGRNKYLSFKNEGLLL